MNEWLNHTVNYNLLYEILKFFYENLYSLSLPAHSSVIFLSFSQNFQKKFCETFAVRVLDDDEVTGSESKEES